LSTASYLLTALLAATPILAIANGPFAQHAVAFVAAIMLAAATGAKGEITTAAQLLKRFWLAVLFPILWMVLQAVPLPFSSLVNPIWPTTSTALNDASLLGHISLDPGATLRKLIVFLIDLSLVVSTIIITKDRRRAETILFVLSAVTTFMSVEVLLGQLNAFAGVVPSPDVAASPFSAAAALAALANGAVIARAIERHLSQPDISNFFSIPLLFGVLSGLSGIAVALAAMTILAQGSLLAITGLGFAVIFFVGIVRRLGFRPWPSAILFAIFLAIVCAVAVPRFQPGVSGLLGFVTSAAPGSLALAERALSDASWLGSGVGTFELMSRTYQDFGFQPLLVPPFTAVSIAIEWGRPALLILVGIAVQLFFFIFRGAVRRGRDSFFPSAAAASVLVVLCQSFVDPSLLTPTAQIIITVMIGLGLSQSSGRTTRLDG
jgi:hypothetical protein